MPAEPQIRHLSYRHRLCFFWALVVVFIVLLPILIFYTTGYRLVFTEAEPEIVTTGGLYLSVPASAATILVDDEPVTGRQFLSAARYIQNIDAGQHRVVVQGDGVVTWVKSLPVYEYRVTEAAAFTVPSVPRARLITEYETPAGASVAFATSSPVFQKATTTPYVVATSSTTSSYAVNEEFSFVQSLFASSSTSTQSVFARMREQVEQFAFRSELPTTTATSGAESATTTIVQGDIELYEDGREVYARWVPESFDAARYFFCIDHEGVSSTRVAYGEHVMADIIDEYGTTTETLPSRVCRRDIRIDRKGQDVFAFDFVPGRSDLVLMRLTDGLYVTEIDDRSWQNVQELYPGEDIRVVIDGGQIFVEEDDQYFEILPALEE